jgi:hypothetical protein
MKTVHGSGDPGQTSDPTTTASIPSPDTPEARSLALLESIDTGIRNLASRVAALELRVADLHREPASSEPSSPPPQPPRISPFAVRSDGKIILAVAHLAGCDLSDRERWEGVVLSDTERGYAIDHLADLFEDAAARTAGRFLRKPTTDQTEP